jgi:hypothetical protein
MASGMISSIGGSGDTLDRLQNMVEEERTKAAGRARVAHDSMDMSGIQLMSSRGMKVSRLAKLSGGTTPGAAEALAVKIYRLEWLVARSQGIGTKRPRGAGPRGFRREGGDCS